MARTSDHLDGLSGDSERKLERLFASFDASWKTGPRPRIVDYLPANPREDRRAALIELVLIDLEYALAKSPAARLEAYFAEFPELSADRDLVLSLADREYRLRRGLGATPTIKEYVARFPDLAARLVFRLEEADEPAEAPTDETVDFGGKSPGPAPGVFLSTAPDPTVPDALPDVGTPRYRHIRAYARGGLGEVFTAEDTVLSRRVALKRIRPQFADDASVRRRFQREAEITARLEHPGIAPIHELIVDRSGQPWYVMRFLKGHTLRSAIERWHKARPSLDEAARSIEFRNLLTRFAAVCETMSYAHRLGVVHRDLTPANVMLGDHGETIVLDWGFATASGDPDHVIDVSSSPAASPLDASILKSGKLFGTPAFMSPEQAGMHQSAVGPASDLYGLGAILFMLLTGRPPFVGNDLAATLRAVQAGEFPRPRELRPVVPAALEAITLKAMSLNPRARYADAQDLAQDIERWQADEPVTAYREPWKDRTRRRARKHRKALAITIALAGLVIALGGSYRVVEARRIAEVEAKARPKIEQAYADYGTAGEDDSKWESIDTTLEKTIRELELAGASGDVIERGKRLRELIDTRKKDQDLKKKLSEARLLAAGVKPDGGFDIEAKLKGYAEAFAAHGLDIQKREDVATLNKIKGPLAPFLVAILDDWALERMAPEHLTLKSNLIAIANEADSDTQGRMIRNAIFGGEIEALNDLASKIDKKTALPERLHTIGNALLRRGKLQDARAFLQDCAALYPGDFWLNLTTGVALSKSVISQGIAGEVQEQMRTHFDRAESKMPNSPGVQLNYGYGLLNIGQPLKAEERFRKALAFDDKLQPARYALGYILNDRKRPAEAFEQFSLALDLLPTDTISQNGLMRSSDLMGARKKSIDFFRAQIARGSSVDRAAKLSGLGGALRADRQFIEAIAVLKESLKLDPNLSPAHNNLGLVYLERGVLDVQRAIEHQREAVRLDGKSPLNRLALGRSLARNGQLEEACQMFREAISQHAGLLPVAHIGLGNALARLGKFPEAMSEFDQSTGDESDTIPTPSDVRRYLELLPHLDGYILGNKQATEDQRVDLARLCRYTGRLAHAVNFWDQQLRTEDPQVTNPQPWDGDPAITALEASLGPALPAEESARFRGKALLWLRNDLLAYTDWIDHAETRRFLHDQMLERKAEPGLSVARDPVHLGKLPDRERAEWTQFWEDVDRFIDETSH